MQLIPYLKFCLQTSPHPVSEKEVAIWLIEGFKKGILDKQYNLQTAMRKLRLLASMNPDKESDRKIMKMDRGRVKRVDGPFAEYVWEPLDQILFSVLREESEEEPEEEQPPLLMMERMTYEEAYYN